MKNGFVIHHNGPPANCIDRPHTRCEVFWASVRSYHVNTKGWSDIAYSFGICPHGARFTGRGWDKNQFANGEDVVGVEDGPDRDWYSVLAFVGGGYDSVPEEKVTPSMLLGLSRLIDEGRDTGRCGLAVLPHKDFKPKPCPGPTLTALARAWDDRPFAPPVPPLTTINEETDMRIIDCEGRPALVVFGDRTHKSINKVQRDALRSAGVPAGLVTDAERTAILALLV